MSALLSLAEVPPVVVEEEGGQGVELGYELLDVGEAGRGGGGAVPGVLDAVEEPVRVVELAALQVEGVAGEGVEAEEEVEGDSRGGVVGAVVELGDLTRRVLPRPVPLG